MEITNEIKAKVFAPYIRIANVQWRDSRDIKMTRILSGDDVDEIFVGKNNILDLPKKIILKPLSAITDEDAKQVIKFEYPHQTIKNISIDNSGIKFNIKLQYSYTSKIISFQSLTLEQGQYLQANGYDLPNYLLDGKTLHEAGFAIYE